MLRLELLERRPNRRFLDVVREDMRAVGGSEEDTVGNIEYKIDIHCGNP